MPQIYFYHQRPADMVGSTLLPLNEMKAALPDIYSEKVKKYCNRESLLQVKIPPLSCLWNDVIHLSPVHPEKVLIALRQAGFDYEAKEYFEISSENAGFSAANCCIFRYQFRPDQTHIDIVEEDFAPYSKDLAQGLDTIPLETLKYYEECRAVDTHPLVYRYIPHILFKGRIETTTLRRVLG